MLKIFCVAIFIRWEIETGKGNDSNKIKRKIGAKIMPCNFGNFLDFFVIIVDIFNETLQYHIKQE